MFVFVVGCKAINPQENCRATLEFGRNNIYYITLPCDKKEQKLMDDRRRISYKYYFKDESIFFTNDYTDDTPYLVYRQMNFNYAEVPSFVFYDSITVQGMDESNETFWKAVKNKGVVMGYENVPENRKEEFDNAILSLTKKDK
jgi:hypothetical protein